MVIETKWREGAGTVIVASVYKKRSREFVRSSPHTYNQDKLKQTHQLSYPLSHQSQVLAAVVSLSREGEAVVVSS